jgi:hypothetical protein
MKNKSKILFGNALKTNFLPLNVTAMAIVLMSAVIAVTPALPITAAPKGPANDISYFRFYLEKKQWLADARTIFAGIDYLRE